MIRRRSYIKRSTKAIARRKQLRARGAAKARREKEQRRYYRSKAFREVRRFVLERDDHRCTFAGFDRWGAPIFLTGVCLNMEAARRCHQREHLQLHELRYPAKGEAPQPNDGVTVCKWCHRIVERMLRPWKRSF